MGKNIYGCAFCDWTTYVWGHGSNPNKAYSRLVNHLEEKHPAEYKKVDIEALYGHPELNDEGETIGDMLKKLTPLSGTPRQKKG